MKVIATEKLPIKMWLETIEDEALAQARNLANLPFAFKHVAIMPDSHVGYGMPIGGVLATRGEPIRSVPGDVDVRYARFCYSCRSHMDEEFGADAWAGAGNDSGAGVYLNGMR